MRKLILASCLFLIAFSATAAEINFLDNPVWSTVLEKAKKEKKMIFLDGYATWCGPCKSMDAETYKDQAVADYYNANFINVKYDMEKGEGKMLAEKYLVTAYPYLMFIDSEGIILHKGIGYVEAVEFVGLGKAAKDPNAQYYTLKKKALELTNSQFEKFVEQAVAFEDEDADDLINQYLSKQSDILGSDGLIRLVMVHASALPNEKMLDYFKANQAKVTKSGAFTKEEYDLRLVSLALGWALSDEIQADPNQVDFDAIRKILDKFVPEKAFFVHHYFKAQFFIDDKKMEEAITELNVLLDNTPAKITLDQICNAMMNMGPELAKAGKIDPLLKKFDAIKIPESDANKAYMKDFVKGIIHIKTGEMDKFKTLANAMIARPDVPSNVKDDLKSALARIENK